MDQRQYRRKTNFLWFLIAVAAAYSWWFQQRRTLTGVEALDGTLGVLLGLFICSRPAGNAIDLLLFERSRLRRLMSQWSSIQWLLLNILTLVVGWVVIYIGTSLLTSRAH
ncbi:MAG: hypothetical protein ACREQK_03090 [Candidatus Binatia bacterium]|jgi:hypothetical protein